ncbi:MAG: hypothetical protein HKO89_06485, partial [Saprospiraceae bacterium]|nr:hypothetical protein [Saprospiraceae bacterium]
AMSQGGNLAMWDKLTGRTQFIKPQHPEGKELRYHWNAALALHPFQDCGLYYGSQYVHKSLDCGQSWEIISPDLTTNDTLKQDQSNSGGLTLDVTGAENHTTILCITPDAEDENVIWVGTDDGNIQLTRNGGASWEKLNNNIPGLPANAWIPQIILSEHQGGEAFVVVNNYRMNDWSAYLFHTEDYGKSWNRMVDDSDVEGFVCSVVQDPENENLLFLGTDVGLYFSLDKGENWMKWEKGLPSVQIRDMKIQDKFDDLVLGTFGRSFYVLDDIKPLRKLAEEGKAILDSTLVVFEPGTVYQTSSRSYDGTRFIAQGDFVGDNKSRGAMFTVWVKPGKEEKRNSGKTETGKNRKEKKPDKKPKDTKDKKSGKEGKGKEKSDKKGKQITILAINTEGDTIRTFKRNIKEGMNRINWRPDSKGVNYPARSEPKEKREPGGMPMVPGEYKMIFEYKGNKDSTVLKVASDPRLDPAQFDPVARYKAMDDFNNVITGVTQAYNNLKEAKKSMNIYKDIIAVQEDSIKEEYGKLNKEISGQIDSLMNLYMLPESGKTEYRDNSKTLTSQLRNGRRFLSAATGAPNENAKIAVANATGKAEKVLVGINEFFSDQWPAYLDKIRALPLDIFKEYETIKIE